MCVCVCVCVCCACVCVVCNSQLSMKELFKCIAW